MGLICLVEEPQGGGTVIFWKDSPREDSVFWKVRFTTLDRNVICSTSPGIFKGSQVLVFFWFRNLSKLKDLLFETCKSSRRYVLETVPFVNILLPVYV